MGEKPDQTVFTWLINYGVLDIELYVLIDVCAVKRGPFRIMAHHLVAHSIGGLACGESVRTRQCFYGYFTIDSICSASMEGPWLKCFLETAVEALAFEIVAKLVVLKGLIKQDIGSLGPAEDGSLQSLLLPSKRCAFDRTTVSDLEYAFCRCEAWGIESTIAKSQADNYCDPT